MKNDIDKVKMDTSKVSPQKFFDEIDDKPAIFIKTDKSGRKSMKDPTSQEDSEVFKSPDVRKGPITP